MNTIVNFGKLALAGLLSLTLAACGGNNDPVASDTSQAAPIAKAKPIEWKMVTTGRKTFLHWALVLSI